VDPNRGMKLMKRGRKNNLKSFAGRVFICFAINKRINFAGISVDHQPA
jgi:hypothetical protein